METKVNCRLFKIGNVQASTDDVQAGPDSFWILHELSILCNAGSIAKMQDNAISPDEYWRLEKGIDDATVSSSSRGDVYYENLEPYTGPPLTDHNRATMAVLRKSANPLIEDAIFARSCWELLVQQPNASRG